MTTQKPTRQNNFRTSESVKIAIKHLERNYLDPKANASDGPYLETTPDSAGNATIGWGHKLQGKEKGKVIKITLPEAQQYFDQDIKNAEDTVNQSVTVPLNQNKFDALVSLVFNVGSTDFRKSKLLHNINSNYTRKYIEREFLDWDHITVGNKLEKAKGLTDRRNMEVELFFTPDPNEPKIYRPPVDPYPPKKNKVKKKSSNEFYFTIKLADRYYLLSKI